MGIVHDQIVESWKTFVSFYHQLLFVTCFSIWRSFSFLSRTIGLWKSFINIFFFLFFHFFFYFFSSPSKMFPLADLPLSSNAGSYCSCSWTCTFRTMHQCYVEETKKKVRNDVCSTSIYTNIRIAIHNYIVYPCWTILDLFSFPAGV